MVNSNLIAVVAVLLILLAGCQSAVPAGTDTPEGDNGPPTPNAGNSDQEFPGWSPGNQTRFSNLSIGNEPDLPEGVANHEYGIWNMRSAEREISLTVWRGNEVILNRSILFPSQGVLWLSIYQPGNYTVVVEPANGSRLVTHQEEFDCNIRAWEIVVFPDGELSSQSYQTLIACGTETG